MTPPATTQRAAKTSPVSIALVKQTMQHIPFSPRPRSSPPCVAKLSPRVVSPVVAGAPESLRGTLGTNQICHTFPHDRHCESSGDIRDKEMRFITMDNGRFHVTLSSELGCRVLSFVDRQAGGELLYQPPMVLNRNIGMAGAWHVGGIEPNAFRYGHLVLGQTTLRATKVRLASGFDAVQVQGFDERPGCSITCVFALLPDRLAMRVTLTNHSPSPQSGYYWTNIAVPANPWTHLMMPPGPMLNHGQGKTGYTDNVWPHIEGFDCRRWLMHHQIMSAYSYAPQGDWMGSADRRTGRTFAHRALRADCAGRKLWSLGSGDQDRVWFDNGVGEPSMGSYMEIQSGRLSTQTHSDLLAPGSSTSWTEEFTGFVNTVSDSDANSEYKAFVKAAESGLDLRLPIRDAAFWKITEPGTVLVEPGPRMLLSERIVTNAAAVPAADIRSAARAGWVGGDAWIAALNGVIAAGKGDAWTELAVAVAASDQTAKLDARLIALAKREDQVGAWASYVQALYADGKQTLPLLRRAAKLLPKERTVLITLAQHELAAGETAAAETLAKSPALRGSEDARAILAEAAFLARQWQACRTLLDAPFHSLGEGQFRMWSIRKECDIVEALTLFRDQGDAERALNLLHEACRLRPAFGVGRDEASQSADAMFYRWAILVLSDRSESAALAANQLLNYTAAVVPMAISSSVGAYALRLAVLTKAACANAMTDSVVAWGEDAARDPRPTLTASKTKHGTGPWYDGGIDPDNMPPGLRQETLLRRCLLRAAAGRPNAFADLVAFPLLSARGELESWLTKQLSAKLRS